MPMAEFTSVVLIAPLVVTLFAATTLKEEVSPLRWALVAGGFAGTVVILRPGGMVFSWAILLPLTLVFTNAWFQVLTSRLARTEKPLTMHFYTGWVGALIATIPLPFVWISLPGWQEWALLCLMGFMGTVGHFFLILAYQRAPARRSRPTCTRRSASPCSAAGSCSRTCPTALRCSAWRSSPSAARPAPG
jgi:drug/metabolite transporter (DMT)-like permease